MESSTVIQANAEEGQPTVTITKENIENQVGTAALLQGDVNSSFVQNSSDSNADNITAGVVTDGEPSQEQVEVGSDHSDTGWETDLEIEEEKEEFDVSGKKVYLKACEIMGIIPASYFVRNIQEPQIIMPHHGIGGKGAKAIAVALVSNTTITHLNLADNGIGSEGAVAIADMLKDNCYITKLDISDNIIGGPGAYAMEDMLKYNTTITECYLRGSHFDDKAADIIADIIRGNLHLTCLDLSYNELGDVAGQVIGPAIADNEALRTLDLSWNHIRKKGAVAVATSLKSNQMLKVFSISSNGFSNDGVVAMAKALEVNSSLLELDISNNRCFTDGINALAKALQVNDTLKQLKLGKNPIQASGVKVIVSVLKTATNTALEVLEFKDITINPEVEKEIAALKEVHPNIQVTHGGLGGYVKPKPRPEPIDQLHKHLNEHNIKLMDVFKKFDAEGNGSVPEADFREAIKFMGLKLLESEVQKLMKMCRPESAPTGDLQYQSLLEVPPAPTEQSNTESTS